MLKRMNYFKVFVLSGFLIITLFATITNAGAYQGNWKSPKATDWNVLSEVWTTYAGGGNDSEVVQLYVKYSKDGSNVGYRSVAVKKDQKVSHKCWGNLNRDKYGYVGIKQSCYHTPGFNA